MYIFTSIEYSFMGFWVSKKSILAASLKPIWLYAFSIQVAISSLYNDKNKTWQSTFDMRAISSINASIQKIKKLASSNFNLDTHRCSDFVCRCPQSMSKCGKPKPKCFALVRPTKPRKYVPLTLGSTRDIQKVFPVGMKE